MALKSKLSEVPGVVATDINHVGRSYYCFCLEQALINLGQAMALAIFVNNVAFYDLGKIYLLINAALEAA